MMDKYPSVSPYAYCAWNPVKMVDPTGMDTLLFSHDGYYEMTLPGGDDIGIIRGRDGSVLKTFAFADNRWCDRFVKLGDLELSVENNNRGKDDKLFNKVVVVDDCFIENMLEESGVNSLLHRDIYAVRLCYALLESRKGRFGEERGKMDFVNKREIQNVKGALFVTTVMGNSLAHDSFNMGNFMWGAAMGRMGIYPLAVWVGSNIDCILNERTFDSADDQRSIFQGYLYSIINLR